MIDTITKIPLRQNTISTSLKNLAMTAASAAHHRLLLLLLLFLLLLAPSSGQPSTSGFSCSPNVTAYPCSTYAFYRAGLTSNLTDLASIGDLFDVSRLMIADPSNISASLLSSPLITGQPLFVPLSCSCNSFNSSLAISCSNTTRIIQSGDTFYGLSVGAFGNLTTYQSVEVVNPALVPTNLSIGDTAIFPIFCKCPNSTQLGNGVNLLVSYVFQPSDNLSNVAALFGVQEQGITSVNGANIQPYDTIFIPVSKLPSLTQPTTATPVPTLKEERKGVVIGLSIGVGILGALLIALIAALLALRGKQRGKEGFTEVERKKMYSEAGGKAGSSAMEVNLMADVSDCLDKYRVFGIKELKEATGGFGAGSLIQGSVYKGCIDGEVYAIKKMKWNAYEELKILQKVNHGNLVKLEGFCIDPEEANCYLIYEFVENGSLHSWLHESHQNEKLIWKTRLRIAIDVANGLQYIHEHTRPRVVHKDIKSSNILLDSNMRAKIANFGLAKSGCNAITMHIVGTQGYISPEYLADGVVSTKMDVFAFGVVLLELISGKEAIDEDGKVLWASASEVFGSVQDEDEDEDEVGRSKRVREWMDDALVGDSFPSESVMNVMAVAVACVSKDPSKRPTMVDIVYALCKSDELVFDVSEDGLSAQVLAR